MEDIAIMINIFLIYGGVSAEHEVSVNSAASFLSAVDFDLYTVTPVYISKKGDWLAGLNLNYAVNIDAEALKLNAEGALEGKSITFSALKEPNSVVFPLLHGPNGEDGSVQGLLEVLDVPYAGPGILPCATGMDKIVSKQLFLQAGIPQVPYYPVLIDDWESRSREILLACQSLFTFPMYVKPANMGSSIGITEAINQEELEYGIQHAFQYDRRLVIEQGVDAREVKIAILGNEKVELSTTCEIIKQPGFFSYEDKYIDKQHEEKFPANLTNKQEKLIQEYAAKGYKVLDGNGMARCDFFVTDNGDIFLNEINLIPGFSANSFVGLWENSGVSYTEMINRLIELGLKRTESKKNRVKVEM